MKRTIVAALFGCCLTVCGTASDFVWPTPNTAWAEGKPYTEFIQPTVSGLVESGMFGCVRNSGWKFHEAIDLFPIKRDRRGEPADPVFVMADGIVRHASHKAGYSSFGRYVVVEHPHIEPGIVTLYAHLLSIGSGVRPGAKIQAGQALGIMGRSATYTIPKNRAHVHVEAGVWLSRNFQSWYNRKGYSNKNRHGVFNGMNIIGFDLLDYLERQRAGQVTGVLDYIRRQPTAITVVVRSKSSPDFVNRYPQLVDAPVPITGLAGWQIELTWFGLPKSWTPLTSDDLAQIRVGNRGIIFHDSALTERFQCQDVVRVKRGTPVLGPKGTMVIDILCAGL